MALVGGGGAGNVAGSSPASIGETLNYIGNHVYAMSGSISVAGASSANTTLLDFSTGSEYVTADLQGFSTERGSAQLYLNVKFNSQDILKTEFDDAGSASGLLDMPIKLIIPPYTHVECLVGIETGATKHWSLIMTGRVYA
jgi:hypothetical protein